MANKTGPSPGGIAGVIAPLVEPITEELGLLLWDVRFIKEGATWILRVIIDKEDTPVSINDCVDVSRRLSPVLDEKDPIPQSYCLEVTSPGADRELTRPEHFDYYESFPVTVTLYRPDDSGRRELTGILLGLDGSALSIQTDEDETLVLDKKTVSSVHAIDEWEYDYEE